MKNFWVSDSQLTMRPVTMGFFSFYVLAETEFTGWAMKEFNVTNYPCMPSVSVITPIDKSAFE
jgi:hypothetical protein